jgi:hypothetical protein
MWVIVLFCLNFLLLQYHTHYYLIYYALKVSGQDTLQSPSKMKILSSLSSAFSHTNPTVDTKDTSSFTPDFESQTHPSSFGSSDFLAWINRGLCTSEIGSNPTVASSLRREQADLSNGDTFGTSLKSTEELDDDWGRRSEVVDGKLHSPHSINQQPSDQSSVRGNQLSSDPYVCGGNQLSSGPSVGANQQSFGQSILGCNQQFFVCLHLEAILCNPLVRLHLVAISNCLVSLYLEPISNNCNNCNNSNNYNMQ